jgi:hypothetical protein
MWSAISRIQLEWLNGYENIEGFTNPSCYEVRQSNRSTFGDGSAFLIARSVGVRKVDRTSQKMGPTGEERLQEIVSAQNISTPTFWPLNASFGGQS